MKIKLKYFCCVLADHLHDNSNWFLWRFLNSGLRVEDVWKHSAWTCNLTFALQMAADTFFCTCVSRGAKGKMVDSRKLCTLTWISNFKLLWCAWNSSEKAKTNEGQMCAIRRGASRWIKVSAASWGQRASSWRYSLLLEGGCSLLPQGY